MKVLLTTPYKIKKSTPIDSNVDDDIITPYIIKAQETHIQQYLGTDLFNKISNDIKNDNLTGNYKTLMDDYIIPCLVEWSFYEILPFISLKLTNKTIGRPNADYLSEGDLNDLKYLRQTVRDVADFYGSRLIGYLKEKSNLFPEYSTNSGMDKLKPQYKTGFYGGVYTGGGNDCTFGLDIKKTRYL